LPGRSSTPWSNFLANRTDEDGTGERGSGRQLKIGMVLARDLLARDGALLLATDYLLDATLVREIQAYAKRESLAPGTAHPQP
jgi:hypothetical protein